MKSKLRSRKLNPQPCAPHLATASNSSGLYYRILTASFSVSARQSGKKSTTSSPEQEERPQHPLKIRFANFGRVKSETTDGDGTADTSGDDISKSEKSRPPSLQPNSGDRNGRSLRKKRSAVGSMEDLWDESAFGENSPAQSTSASAASEFVEPAPPPPIQPNGPKRATPVLKISFGTRGQGTVLKIPSRLNGPAAQVPNLNLLLGL